jgi:hypothetical protein
LQVRDFDPRCMARAAALEFAHRQGVDARLNHAALQIEIVNRWLVRVANCVDTKRCDSDLRP